eukprot:COSAG06_NODE_33414_length_490_cov_1.002558_1_plen_29_part_10
MFVLASIGVIRLNQKGPTVFAHALAAAAA